MDAFEIGERGTPRALRPALTDEQMLENVRSSLARPSPRIHRAARFKAHERHLSVAAGGPSLADTFPALTGDIAAVNGSLGFLKERRITPWACGVLDPRPHMTEIVEADPDVIYFVASIVDPGVFDKLEKAGCDIVLWHPSGMFGIEGVPGVDLVIGGGCTMGLRWMTLGYVMGYRSFDLHGLDSSYRGRETHAYPDPLARDRLTHKGRETSPNFIEQVVDFMFTLDRFEKPDMEATTIRVFGDGLLQDEYKRSRHAADALRG